MYYIGLMSGTSTDAVDGVLADEQLNIIASYSQDIPMKLRQTLLSLNSSGDNELARSAIAANQLVDVYTDVVLQLLKLSGLAKDQVLAIGAHGQTIRHVPEQSYTIQLNSPARLVEQTGIAVVADFRSRDIAAGGQGAPLVPAFHAALFGQNKNKAVLNLGGIANITILDNLIKGFDTGPANMLMDAWIKSKLDRNYDHNGEWAISGTSQADLLLALLDEPWFKLAPPKSTGRDLFNLSWLEAKIEIFVQAGRKFNNNDIQATLLDLTANTVCNAINNYAKHIEEIILCGGGAHNAALVKKLAKESDRKISSSDAYGVPSQYMEALAFAWLAKANLDGLHACLPSVTGAKHPSIAGCIYPV